MPQTETFNLGSDGKAIPGVTVLRDPQTGRFYDVVRVMRAEDETPALPFRGGSSSERCALNGGTAKWREG